MRSRRRHRRNAPLELDGGLHDFDQGTEPLPRHSRPLHQGSKPDVTQSRLGLRAMQESVRFELLRGDAPGRSPAPPHTPGRGTPSSPPCCSCHPTGPRQRAPTIHPDPTALHPQTCSMTPPSTAHSSTRQRTDAVGVSYRFTLLPGNPAAPGAHPLDQELNLMRSVPQQNTCCLTITHGCTRSWNAGTARRPRGAGRSVTYRVLMAAADLLDDRWAQVCPRVAQFFELACVVSGPLHHHLLDPLLSENGAARRAVAASRKGIHKPWPKSSHLQQHLHHTYQCRGNTTRLNRRLLQLLRAFAVDRITASCGGVLDDVLKLRRRPCAS